MVPGLNIACRRRRAQTTSCHNPDLSAFLTALYYADRSALRHEMQFDEAENRWAMDFDAMQELITPSTRLFNFCNPHNPQVVSLREKAREDS